MINVQKCSSKWSGSGLDEIWPQGRWSTGQLPSCKSEQFLHLPALRAEESCHRLMSLSCIIWNTAVEGRVLHWRAACTHFTDGKGWCRWKRALGPLDPTPQLTAPSPPEPSEPRALQQSFNKATCPSSSHVNTTSCSSSSSILSQKCPITAPCLSLCPSHLAMC